MHAFSLALALAAAQAPVPASPRPAPVAVPVPVTAPAEAPPVRPTMVTDEPAPAAPSAAVPTPITAPPASNPSTAPGSSPATAARAAVPAAPAAPLPQAAVEKLGQGDRAFLAGEYRNALFAYQDAVYLAPRSAVARVRLGRAYLALRYPSQATAQAEQALALDPENPDARQLASDAKAAPSRPAGQPAGTGAPPARNAAADVPATVATPAVAPAAIAPQNGGGKVAPPPASHVYPFAESAPATGAAVVAAAVAPAAPSPPAAVPIPPAAAPAAQDPGRETAPADPAAARTAADARAGGNAIEAQTAHLAAPDPAGPTAGQRYRAALELMANREFEKAIGELTQAIVLDPRLAVAYAARASARFGIGRYREAADDYRASLAIDENLGTPLYGLAECYRVLGEGKRASEMYQRYADSKATDVREDLRTISAKRAQELR